MEEVIKILDICLLGTGGMMPLPYRWLTSLMARYNGSSILIDCGEGTQIAMKEKGWSPKPIDIMCFTHYHADHISGLPGMLLTMGNAEKTTPLLMIGPKGLTRVVNALRVVAPELPFEINYLEITEPEQCFCFEGFHIEAFRVNHNVLCYGYNIVIERKGKFQIDKAMELGLDKKYWNRLQKGEVIELDGRIYTPDMVMGEQRKGFPLNLYRLTFLKPIPILLFKTKRQCLIHLKLSLSLYHNVISVTYNIVVHAECFYPKTLKAKALLRFQKFNKFYFKRKLWRHYPQRIYYLCKTLGTNHKKRCRFFCISHRKQHSRKP